MVALDQLRILELGAHPFLQKKFPGQVLFVDISPDKRHVQRPDLRQFGPMLVPALWRWLHRPGFDLIVCHVPTYCPWNPRWMLRTLFTRRILRGEFPFVHGLAMLMLRGRLAAPLAIVDTNDARITNRFTFALMDRARVYFKRELPVDHWQIFTRTAHPSTPTGRFRQISRFRRCILKLRPIGLTLDDRVVALARAVIEMPEKTTDLFVAAEFAGGLGHSSTVRSFGLSEIAALSNEGYRVDIAARRLPHDEFVRSMSRAWLTWSPEGLGWDCFRHYESAAFWSVPLLSRPTIYRYRPMEHDKHAVVYDVEPGGLARAVRAALARKDRLRTMAETARAHVLQHHTERAVCEYIVTTALTPEEPSAPSVDGVALAR